MALLRSATLRIADGTSANEQDLSPAEFFVLSRVDGRITVADVLRASGMPPEEAERVLSGLVERGLVQLGGPIEAPARTVKPSSSRQRALRSQLAAARAAAAASEPRPVAPEPVVEPVPEEPLPVHMVGDRDERIRNGIALTREQQRRVLALFDRLLDLSPFELLGIRPTHDLKEIRRAYHMASRELHPDAYFGQELGDYHDRLSALFRRATQAYEALQDADVRTPFVDAEIARKAEARHRVLQAAAQKQHAADLATAQAEAEAAARRHDREITRARRRRERLQHSLRERIELMLVDAAAAERAGNLASAANLYRLALQLHPDDVEIREHWERCRDLARRARAAQAFAQAMSYHAIGHSQEMVPLLVEAAEAHPTVEHLAWAADAVGATDPVKARNFAMGALDGLAAEPETVRSQRKAPELALVHLMIARAFVAAGQLHSAREQARIAEQHRPGDPEVRALLKSIKA